VYWTVQLDERIKPCHLSPLSPFVSLVFTTGEVFSLRLWKEFQTKELNQQLVREKPQLLNCLAQDYIRTWFFLDLISSIPLDYIFLIFNSLRGESFVSPPPEALEFQPYVGGASFRL
jgi:hypothetical protein